MKSIFKEKGLSVSRMETIDKIQLLSKKLDVGFDLLELWDTMDVEAKVYHIEDLIKLLAQFWLATGSNVTNMTSCDLDKLSKEVDYKNAVSFLRDQFVDEAIREAYVCNKSVLECYESIAKPVNNPLMATLDYVNPAKPNFMNPPEKNKYSEHVFYTVAGLLRKNGFNDVAAEEYAATYVNQYGDDAPKYARDIFPEDVDID